LLSHKHLLITLTNLYMIPFWLYGTIARMRVAASEKTKAEKIHQIKRAEGEEESKYLTGVGIARQCQAIVDGLRDIVLALSENVPGTTPRASWT
jgi:hypothetical protein